MLARHDGRRRAANLFVLILPAAILLAVAWTFASRQPNWDDYYAVLPFAGADDGSWGAAFRQLNEHRIAFTRLTAHAVLAVGGPLDLRVLVLIGDLGLIGLAWLLCAVGRAGNRGVDHSPWLDTAPVMLLMTCLHHWECASWAMASLQHFWGALWSSLALVLLARSAAPAIFAGMVVATLAVATNTNGLLVLPLATAFHAVRGITSGGRTRRSALTTAVVLAITATALTAGYLSGYQLPTDRPPGAPNVVAIATYTLALLGSFVVVPQLAVTAGAVVLGLAVACLTRAIAARDLRPDRLLLIAFVLLSALLVAGGRAPLGIEQAVTSRYRHLALLAVCVVWQEMRRLDVASVRSVRGRGRVMAGAALLMALGSFVFVTSMADRHRRLERARAAFLAGEPIGAEQLAPPDGNEILREAVARGTIDLGR